MGIQLSSTMAFLFDNSKNSMSILEFVIRLFKHDMKNDGKIFMLDTKTNMLSPSGILEVSQKVTDLEFEENIAIYKKKDIPRSIIDAGFSVWIIENPETESEDWIVGETKITERWIDKLKKLTEMLIDEITLDN